MYRKSIKSDTVTLTKDDCILDVWCEPEVSEPEDHFENQEDVDLVIEGIESGNEWAWCVAVVRATWHPFINMYADDTLKGDYIGYDTLGGCSYKSREDFINSGDYYDDMVSVAVENLNNQLKRLKPEAIAADLIDDGNYNDEEMADIEKRFPFLTPLLDALETN